MPKDVSHKKAKKAAAAAPEASTSAAASSAPAAAAASKQAKKDKKAGKKAGKQQQPPAAAPAAAKVEDEELDSLFKTAASFALPKPEPAPIAIRVPQTFMPSQQEPTSKLAKRKRDERKDGAAPAAAAAAKARKAAAEAAVANDEELSELEEGDSDDDEDLEEAYERKLAALGSDDDDAAATGGAAPVLKPTLVLEDVVGMDVDGASAGGPSALVHESVGKAGAVAGAPGKLSKTQAKKAAKLPTWAPEGETQEQRDARTVFIGNLSVDVAKDKKLLHQLHAHLLTALPSLAKIESTRFRSAAFANPTEELPAEDADKEAQRAANRQRERTKAWRDEQETKASKDAEGEAALDAQKTFMTPEEKKRVAFIRKDFHASADFTNAYVVFAHAHPDRATNVAPLLDPYEAAKLAATRVNGTVFNGRTVRVDLVRASAASAPTARAKSQLWIAGTDPKRSIFVGNLGLEEKEEGLRAFFEQLLVAERGEVPAAAAADAAAAGAEQASDRWVVNVRIIRDKGTGLGKGFAYVATRDRDCVDEVLALPEDKLKFNKRKLRVQRCKTLPGKPKPSPGDASASAPLSARDAALAAAAKYADPRATHPHNTSKPLALPKGNPLLGEQIKDLTKDERKVAKAEDADRLARRLAKKKARVTMDRQGGPGAAPAGKRESVKLGSFGGKGAKGKVDLKAKKSRTRSEHAAAGRNKKKA